MYYVAFVNGKEKHMQCHVNITSDKHVVAQ